MESPPEPPSSGTHPNAEAAPSAHVARTPSADRETATIRRILAAQPSQGARVAPKLHGPTPRVGPGDDAAVDTRGQVVTVDALLEGVHFDHRLSPADVGYKAIAASVSDVCAMGATPTWATLALSLPEERAAWVEAFAAGLAEACATFGVALVGGDTTASPGPVVVSVTMGGDLLGRAWLRSGAAVGDDLWVTGTLGSAGAGWRLQNPPHAALASLRRPVPPVAFGRAIARQQLVTAAMDLSDGLAADLVRLCAASGRSARLELSSLPIDPALPDALDHALRGGEDYQLLFTARPRHREALLAAARVAGVRLTRVGTMTADAPSQVRAPDGAALAWPAPAFDHFAGASC